MHRLTDGSVLPRSLPVTGFLLPFREATWLYHRCPPLLTGQECGDPQLLPRDVERENVLALGACPCENRVPVQIFGGGLTRVSLCANYGLLGGHMAGLLYNACTVTKHALEIPVVYFAEIQGVPTDKP